MSVSRIIYRKYFYRQAKSVLHVHSFPANANLISFSLAALHGVVNNLMEVVEPAKSSKGKRSSVSRLVPLDVEAMAYIMVALGICYDLSGKTSGYVINAPINAKGSFAVQQYQSQ